MPILSLSRCLHHRASTIAGAASAAAAIFLSNSDRSTTASDHHDHDVTGTQKVLTVCPRFDFRNWRSNLSKCEAVNNGDTASNATFFSTNAAAIYNEEGENEESDATDIIDYYYKKMNPNDVDRTSLMDSHAIFGALRGKDLIERYHVYQRVNMNTEHQLTIIPSSRELAVVDLKVGKKLNGHRGITHGGIISLLFDEAMGWAYECLQQQDHIDSSGMTIVTANLTVDFRAPLLEGSEAVIRVYHNETKGRKIYFSAKLESKDGNVLFAEATSLFILARSDKLRTKER